MLGNLHVQKLKSSYARACESNLSPPPSLERATGKDDDDAVGLWRAS